MGCLHSKKETSDLHPNVFRVVNIDESGAELCSGQLEITDSNIVLYREGRETTVWPLHSLRRYGFESEIFSFESGRRCETGAGIYAFRCRRASLLFRTLQQQIQLRNVIHDAVTYPVSRLTPSPQGRQTLQASVVHRSSVDNGQPLSDTLRPVINNLAAMVPNGGPQRLVNPSPRSPSSADILEVMPLYPRNQNTSNHATNVYEVTAFKREHNNNTQPEAATDLRPAYSNDLNRELAILRSTLKHETALNSERDIEDEKHFLKSSCVKETNFAGHKKKSPLSPTLSSSSEHYAQLSLEQQEFARLYMNIGPNDKHPEVNRKELPPTTPPTPKPMEYCNLSVSVKQEINTYANLAMRELGESGKNSKQTLNFSAQEHQKLSDSDTLTSMPPVEELEVNYAILDIDLNKEAVKNPRDLSSSSYDSQSCRSSQTESATTCVSQIRKRLVSQSSIEKPPSMIASTPTANIGYTTIDFDKTVALTSVAAGTDADAMCDGSRKTRHNSCNLVCGSPSSGDKNKTFL